MSARALITAAAQARATGTGVFPVVYEALGSERDPVRFIARERDTLHASLRRAGAVLLRGFALTEPAVFARAAVSFGGPLAESYEGPSPRVRLAPGVYSASEVWSALVVAEHAEMSYLPRMPRYLYFWCRRPARRGGATTLVDGRRVLSQLDARLVAPLRAGPLRIRRRHARPRGWHDPFELKRWPALFGSKQQELVAQRAAALGYTLTFERSGALTLEQAQPAVRRHPETGEEAWLNHLLVFHRSATRAILTDALLRGRALRAALPYPLALAYSVLARLGYRAASDVRLASGAPIARRALAHVREVVAREAVPVDWRAGDLLLVDNHLVLHGRRPFSGPREVIVAFSDARA